jgi:hypothetical protein
MATQERHHIAERIHADPRQRNAATRVLRHVADAGHPVGQIRKALGSDRRHYQSPLTLVIDVELLSVEWALQFSIVNEGKGDRTKSRRPRSA